MTAEQQNQEFDEVPIMKAVINEIYRHGYSQQMLYRFQDIRYWGDHIIISICYLIPERNLGTRQKVFRAHRGRFEEEIIAEVEKFLQMIFG